MLETRHSNTEFLGKDGFQWFIAQVAPDKAWRTEDNQSFNNGFRAKIRILGYHPHQNEKEGGISDENLPWAHFLVAPQFGAGNNNTGTSFALQGGEMVVGFFLDGEEAQQPVVIGAFFANYNIEDIVSYNEALKKGTTGFGALSFDHLLDNADGNSLINDVKPKTSGVIIDSDGYVPDNNKKKTKTKLKANDNVTKKVRLSSAECEDAKQKMSNISKALQEIFEVFSKLTPFSGGFIDPVLGKIIDFDKELDKAVREISGAMAGVIRGVRYKAFDEINKKINEKLDFLSPTWLTDSIKAKKLKDGFYCAIENVLKGLQNFIKKFLKELFGKVVNIPLCAAEQFLGGLIAGITDKIQSAIAPILGALSAFTGKAMPSFSGLMADALGRVSAAKKLFDCTGGKCDDAFDFVLNSGPDPKSVLKLDNILSRFHTLNGSGLPNLLDDLVDLSFPNQAKIGDTTGSPSGSSPLAGLVDGCNVSSKQCYPPRVVIFGGGGIGAAADAVVNEIGEVIGVRMQDTGVGYLEPPFVSIVDDCDIGRGATAEAIVEDGEVINIIISNGGSNYLGGEQIADTEGVDVIGEVDGVRVVSTGAGYQEGDLIVSDSGQTMTPVIEDGRIVGGYGKVDQGLSEIPAFTIQSETGFGADVIPITRFVKREAYTDPIVPQAKIITVISCPRFY